MMGSDCPTNCTVSASHHHHLMDGKDWIYPGSICNGNHEMLEDTIPTEQMVVNEDTGGVKGSKDARFDLIPAFPLWCLAEHYGKGAKKYEERNWEKGLEYHLCFAAMLRHVTLWWLGEEEDNEGFNHLSAIAFHAFALRELQRTHPELDTRPKDGEQ